MTALDSPRAVEADATVELPAVGRDRLDPDVPVAVEGTELLDEQPGSGYVEPPRLVRRCDGQILQVTPLLYAVLEAVDGQRDYAAIADHTNAVTGRSVGAEDVRALIDTKLRPLGLVLGQDGGQPELQRAAPILALRARKAVVDRNLTRRLTAPFARLFHPVVVTLSVAAFAFITYWVLFRKGLGSAAYDAFHRPGLLLAVFAITVVSAGLHEFGHAAALRRGGGTPGAMGVGLYLIYPVFYTDVTDAYRLGRGARIRTDLGGLYFNALVAVAMYATWLATGWDGLLLVIAAQILQMVRQLPPLVRFDGYHLLADITGVPDLFHRIGPTLRSFVPGRHRRQDTHQLKRWARVVVTVWTVLVVPLLAATMLLTIIALPRIIGTTVQSVAAQGRAFGAAAGHGDAAGATVKALAIVALVVPVGGIAYLLIRIVRRYLTVMWRRTAGRPRQRALGCVAVAALVAGLLAAWWPRPGVYRPIGPHERGTIQDAIPAANKSALPGTLHAGELRTVPTVWAAGEKPPTRAHPLMALVLVPKTANAPTWVFPFDRPDLPGPGDNQSLAVITRDGGTAYDVAFAMVWSNGGTVLNTNSAYAFASCSRCQAVAISFQVVLVVGQADVQAPQNIAVAVAYNCYRCVVNALALQLVTPVTGQLTPQTTTALQALWQQISAFSQHLGGLSLAQIRAQLQAYESEILAIVAPSPSPSMLPSSPAGVATTTAPGGTPAPADSAGTPPPATDSATPSESPSQEPSSSSTGTSPPSPSPTGS